MLSRRCLLLAATALGTELLLPAARPAWSAGPAGIHWHDEVQSAWKSMQSERRPILLFVTMDGCLHCRRMKAVTYEDGRVVERISQSFVAASINGQQQPEVARRLGVQVYPTTVIITPDARVVDSIRGYVSPAELDQRLAAISQRLASVTR